MGRVCADPLMHAGWLCLVTLSHPEHRSPARRHRRRSQRLPRRSGRQQQPRGQAARQRPARRLLVRRRSAAACAKMSASMAQVKLALNLAVLCIGPKNELFISRFEDCSSLTLRRHCTVRTNETSP